MSCKLTQRFVPGYLDGELDLSRTIEMETHLQVCAECARELKKQQALGLQLPDVIQQNMKLVSMRQKERLF